MASHASYEAQSTLVCVRVFREPVSGLVYGETLCPPTLNVSHTHLMLTRALSRWNLLRWTTRGPTRSWLLAYLAPSRPAAWIGPERNPGKEVQDYSAVW